MPHSPADLLKLPFFLTPFREARRVNTPDFATPRLLSPPLRLRGHYKLTIPHPTRIPGFEKQLFQTSQIDG